MEAINRTNKVIIGAVIFLLLLILTIGAIAIYTTHRANQEYNAHHVNTYIHSHPDEAYQIRADHDSLYLYNDDRYLGAISWSIDTTHGIDSLILKDIRDNQ